MLGLLVTACSTLGTPASDPGPLPHAGTGQFRALTAAETMLGSSPPGLTLTNGSRALDSAMVIEGNLFYSASALRPPDAGRPDAGMDDAGTDDAGMDADVDAGDPMDAGVPDTGAPDTGGMPRDASAAPDTDVDAGPMPARNPNWTNYPDRAVYRSTPGEGWGFAAGTMVFGASEGWEGGYVTDPWVVRRPGGGYLLYYAAAGGIGVASASSLDGPWTRENGGAPILPTTSEGTPRRPSVIVTSGMEGAPAPMMLYYELAGTLRIASSTDGIALHDEGAITTTPIEARDDRDGVEYEVGAPGAIAVATPGGRTVLRIYYESRRQNGTVLVGMLGSGDGLHFDQARLPVFAERDRQRPAARTLDQRTTILYTFVMPGTSATGSIIASISPAGVRLNDVAPRP